jgi:hypothetical protein
VQKNSLSREKSTQDIVDAYGEKYRSKAQAGGPAQGRLLSTGKASASPKIRANGNTNGNSVAEGRRGDRVSLGNNVGIGTGVTGVYVSIT